MNSVRALLWPILAWGLLQAAYCQDEPPKPRFIMVPIEQFEQLQQVTEAISAGREALNATIIDQAGTILSLQGKSGLLAAQLKAAGDAAVIAAENFKVMQDLNEKLEKQLRNWKVFGNTVLTVLFGLAFLGAFLTTKNITKDKPSWMLWAVRIAICLAAGVAASSGLFYIITRLI